MIKKLRTFLVTAIIVLIRITYIFTFNNPNLSGSILFDQKVKNGMFLMIKKYKIAFLTSIIYFNPDHKLLFSRYPYIVLFFNNYYIKTKLISKFNHERIKKCAYAKRC